MDKTFFAGIKIEEIDVSGVRIRFPICYFDSSTIAASFPAPAAKVQEVLPSNKLKPVQFVPGTAAIALAAMEYPGAFGSQNRYCTGRPGRHHRIDPRTE